METKGYIVKPHILQCPFFPVSGTLAIKFIQDHQSAGDSVFSVIDLFIGFAQKDVNFIGYIWYLLTNGDLYSYKYRFMFSYFACLNGLSKTVQKHDCKYPPKYI